MGPIREADALWAAWDRAYSLGVRFLLAVGVCLVLYAAVFCQLGCASGPRPGHTEIVGGSAQAAHTIDEDRGWTMTVETAPPQPAAKPDGSAWLYMTIEPPAVERK